MADLRVLGEFYFSQLLNKPIRDAKGHRVGKLLDIAIRWDSVSPHVTGIRYTKGLHDLIPIGLVTSWDHDGLRLDTNFDLQLTCPLHEEETFIGKWLLDKQIIDLEGSRLVRVNDISLSWVSHEDHQYLVLVAVDIGVRGLFRRLGVEFLLSRVENKFVGCQYIKPLENRTSALQLTREKEQLRQLHPADIADIVENMDYKQRANFLDALDSQQAIDALAEMELDTQVEVINQMDEERASDILEEMPPDEAADILSELSSQKSEELLNLMESEDAEDVRELMQYEEDTAGSLMTTEYIGLPFWLTAEQAINELRRLAPDAETIYYLYVVDEQETLEGVLSLRELIIASPETTLKDLMHTKILRISPYDDHEKVADLIHKYGLLAVPVVNSQDQILGIITVDDVLELLMPDRPRVEIYSTLIARRRQAKGGHSE
ncbi:magnesium transporter [Desulfosporosinus sp. BICA1-9]|uniref:magnesium transporter n=1 Tax=Desulfosporosinus sp. BICA1-9 TaxID=1531958 RepID=UPI00054B4666|nr:CBS domain-containing protein [Desulfosporosinus sp. BICA1-9]KJS47584.1 MAG: magnesium transporter MgtE [Peptococcaceae bacterium BRH_c23]KJS89686.1 MAG: magnesium transporter MgtE [Desulfosporosinus sp. BICA1-9]HBW37104.1 magnesium transporter [Desulfosporosinus sp.]